LKLSQHFITEKSVELNSFESRVSISKTRQEMVFGSGFAPFRFLTPFPRCSSRHLRNSPPPEAQTYSVPDSFGFPRTTTRKG